MSVCEDSDPKVPPLGSTNNERLYHDNIFAQVRDTVAKVLAQLAVTVRSRGRAAVEAHRVLTGLETSAPR